MMKTAILALGLVFAPISSRAARTLTVYFIDTEGGQSTLIVAPSGQSLLIDTGWNERDASRIAAVAKSAGLQRIDYLLVSHYHPDHVGGVPQLAVRIPITHVVEHGPTIEHGPEPDALCAGFVNALKNAQQIVARPGDKIPVTGLNVQVLSAAGTLIAEPVTGAGLPNPYCDQTKLADPDPSENSQSIGVLVSFGNFRLLDLADLPWNQEFELVCPTNRVGTVDVYVTGHHGGPNAPALVDAIHSRVAIMNNGAQKGGNLAAWDVVHTSPGLEDFWQLHYAVPLGPEHNVSEQFIANLGENESDKGYSLRMKAYADRSFTVTNDRNGYSKTYPSRTGKHPPA